MDNYPFYELIATFAFVIAALISITIGILRKTIVGWIIGISILLVLLLYTLIANPNMSIALSAFSTIALTIFAAVTLFLNYQARKDATDREERDRNARNDRENRDRKERLLNEIIEWAEDVAKLNFKIYNVVEAQISKESWVENGIGEIVSQFQLIEAKGDYINSIALSSFKVDKKLSKDIKAVNKEIRELVDVSVKRMDGEVTTEAVQEHMNILRLKILELFKEAAKIKTRDIS